MDLVKDAPLKYDKYGRLLYNPMFHEKSGTPWTYEDELYLKAWYYIIGPEEMSYALERTMSSIMGKVAKLNEEGIMKTPSSKVRKNRIKKNPLARVQCK